MRKFEGFMRGVNLGGWLSQCDENTDEYYASFITEEDIKAIAAAGLDHVRVPVDYPLLETEEGTPLICLHEVIYDQRGRPLHTNIQLIRGERFVFTI